MGSNRRFSGGIALGIVGIIFSVIFPAAAYGTSVPGIVLSVKKLQKGYKATAALVLNIVAVSLAFVNSVVAIVITARGFFMKRTGEF